MLWVQDPIPDPGLIPDQDAIAVPDLTRDQIPVPIQDPIQDPIPAQIPAQIRDLIQDPGADSGEYETLTAVSGLPLRRDHYLCKLRRQFRSFWAVVAHVVLPISVLSSGWRKMAT